ncbi:LLM class flavin-dependent oxidoreductase [Mycolicibacterium farcinogenes]|uniref:LLM class flavin-dependent oxidoreductase n=1 Tax=Mycolicibacterium farcinogenes TaxID=1802 RepID=UPI001C8D513A|nr:LLM class flavin-dependent oxidoreductase [Mycolicibacterium farcinogenes]QZH62484.1 LLM class flavin-dependent oxidoreductase [Mycolicibacterium farcinogenes]
MNVPLSILDLAPISAGSDAVAALHNAVDLARHAEQWGFQRYWVAEHHFVSVASSSPAVLVGQIAAATERIRVGTAAVQLGHTTAVAVVEAFGTLAAFHSGRIDLGVGRSGQKRAEAVRDKPREPRPPRQWHEIDGVVIPTPYDVSALMRDPRLRSRMAVLQQPQALTPDFAEQVDDILAMLAGRYEVGTVVPGAGAALTPWVFGSSKGHSARVAAARGLPFVASYHITPATALEAIEVYRNGFTPSEHLSEPYVAVSADVVVADDEATARHLASSYGHWVYSIRAGGGAAPYPDPADCAPLTPEQLEVVRDRTATQFVGDPDQVAARLEALARVSGADELVITSVTHRHSDRLRSHQLIAERWVQ